MVLEMETISAIIITKNEEPRIQRCLQHLSWADEIVVVDSYSTDKTLSLCEAYTNRLYQRQFDTFHSQRNFAIDHATMEWILSVDADELIDESLRNEIKETLANPDEFNGFLIPMESYLFKEPVRYTWGRNLLLRLFRREKGRFVNPIHEKVKVEGRTGVLKNPLYHYNSDSLEQFIQKNNLYTTLEAKQKYDAGERFNSTKAILSPLRIFFFRYIRLKGYKDGPLGLALSILLAIFNIFVHLKLWQLCRVNRKGPLLPC
jgi:glycosyltransferase involved in cell wall biosynthesis